MLAEQLLTFAEDFVAEYQRLGVIAAIQEAVQALQQRGTPEAAHYQNLAGRVRQKCQTIVANTKFGTYPAEWQHSVSLSGFAPCLPATVAWTLINALPEERDIAPLSTELAMLQSKCSTAVIVAQHFIPFAKSFRLERVDIPRDRLGVLVTVPRVAFENRVQKFSAQIAAYSDLLASVAEIVTGQRDQPELVYASTSDPTTCISTVLEIAVPFLHFYAEVLRVIVNQFEILKAFGILRRRGLEPPTLSEDNIRDGVEAAVGKLIDTHCNVADDGKGRRQELQNELVTRMMAVVPSLISGSRVSIAVTTSEKVTTHLIGVGEQDKEISQLTELTQKLEVDLNTLISTEPTLAIAYNDASRKSDSP